MAEVTGQATVVLIACGMPDGSPTPADGRMLAAFDFEMFGGVGGAVFTDELAEAMRFPSIMSAWQFLKRSPICKPLREDGLPNRPLTSTNWTIRQVDLDPTPGL
jgi:hypothetical protein